MLNGFRLVAMYSLVPTGYLLFGPNGAIVAVAVCAIVNAAGVLALQARLGLLEPKGELLGVPLFAFGLLLGTAGAQLLKMIA